jgi:hypothetical protein
MHPALIWLILVSNVLLICAGQNLPSFAINVQSNYVTYNASFIVQHFGTLALPFPKLDYNTSNFEFNIPDLSCAHLHTYDAELNPGNDSRGGAILVAHDLTMNCTSRVVVGNLKTGKKPINAKMTSIPEAGELAVRAAMLNSTVSIIDCATSFDFKNTKFESDSELEDELLDGLFELVDGKLSAVISAGVCQAFLIALAPAHNATSRELQHPFDMDEAYSVFGGVHKLLQIDEYLLGLLLLLFSGIWPYLKLLVTITCWVLHLERRPCEDKAHFRDARCGSNVLFWLELFGKWSYLDVLTITLLACMLTFDVQITAIVAHIRIVPCMGAYVYAGAVLLSLVSTSLVKHEVVLDMQEYSRRHPKHKGNAQTLLREGDEDGAADVMWSNGGDLDSVVEDDEHLLPYSEDHSTSNSPLDTRASPGGSFFSSYFRSESGFSTLTSPRGPATNSGLRNTRLLIYGNGFFALALLGFSSSLPFYTTVRDSSAYIGDFLVESPEGEITEHHSIASDVLKTCLNQLPLSLPEIMPLGWISLLLTIVIPAVKWMVLMALMLRADLTQSKVQRRAAKSNLEQVWLPFLHAGSSWDMRDVYMLTLVVLYFRVPGIVETISSDYVDVVLHMTTSSGLYLTLLAVILDWITYFPAVNGLLKHAYA